MNNTGAIIDNKTGSATFVAGAIPAAPIYRLATLADYDAIHTIEATASRELGSRYPARMKRSIDNGKVTVVETDGQVIGFVEWNNPQRGVNIGWYVVYKIAVLPAYRNLGIGRHLLQTVGTPMLLQCKYGTAANEFYQGVGMEWVRFDGKLNKYQVVSWT